jgi:hypothetical protein
MEEDAEEIVAREGAVHAKTRDTQLTPRGEEKIPSWDK